MRSTPLLAFALLAIGCTPRGEGDAALASATTFTKTFYDWYVPKADKGTGLEIATSDSARLFDPGLRHALSEDSAAQAKDSTEVVGLDGDPFLNAQDFCQSYEIGAARRDSTHILVEVFGVCDGKKHESPDVIAELAPRGSSFVFTDFRYPGEHSTLLRVLADLKVERERTPKKK